MRLCKFLHFLFGFIFGSLFGGLLISYAAMHAIETMPLERTAQRAVQDVEQAYQNALSKDDAFNLCIEQNSRLKKKVGHW